MSSDDSVKQAASSIATKFDQDAQPLYGIVNNAGVGFGHDLEGVLQVNTYGIRRVTEAFISQLIPSGRIVNVRNSALFLDKDLRLLTFHSLSKRARLILWGRRRNVHHICPLLDHQRVRANVRR